MRASDDDDERSNTFDAEAWCALSATLISRIVIIIIYAHRHMLAGSHKYGTFVRVQCARTYVHSYMYVLRKHQSLKDVENNKTTTTTAAITTKKHYVCCSLSAVV